MYPSDHKFSDRELQAWNAMLKAVGCTNITPFSNRISPVSYNNFILYYYSHCHYKNTNLQITVFILV